jgi:chaperone required for assembly of F1-ATPase
MSAGGSAVVSAAVMEGTLATEDRYDPAPVAHGAQVTRWSTERSPVRTRRYRREA